MKAILIDPETKTVKEIDIADNVHAMRAILKCDLLDSFRLTNERDYMYIDDEGLINANYFFALTGIPLPFAGRGLIMGADSTGETIPPVSVTVEGIENGIRFISHQEALEMAEKWEEENLRDEPGTIYLSAADILRKRAYTQQTE